MDEKTAANPQSAVYNEKAYDIAEKNTLYDKNGRVMISKDDEWLNEPEWEKCLLKWHQKAEHIQDSRKESRNHLVRNFCYSSLYLS